MRTTAVRLGLFAAVAGVLVLGRPADATDGAGMTRQEASAFKKEIAAKLKAFEQKIREIQAEAIEATRHAFGPGANEYIQKIRFDEAAKIAAAQKEFLDALRACVDGANEEQPDSADMAAGSPAQAAVDAGNAAVSKGAAKEARELQKIQAASVASCKPVAVYTHTPPMENRRPGAGSLGTLPPRREMVTTFACKAWNGDIMANATSTCTAPHEHTDACKATNPQLAITDSGGTRTFPMTRGIDEFVWSCGITGNFTEGPCLVEVVPTSTPTAETDDFKGDSILISCFPPEDPAGDCQDSRVLVSAGGEVVGRPFGQGGSRDIAEARFHLDMGWVSVDPEVLNDLDVHFALDQGVASHPVDYDIVPPEELGPGEEGATCFTTGIGYRTGKVHFENVLDLNSPEATGPIVGWCTLTNPTETHSFKICQSDVPFMEPACIDEVVVTVNGSVVPTDPRTTGDRYLLANGVRMQIDYSDPATPGGDLFLFVNLLDPHPSSGEVSMPVVSTSPVQETGAEIYRNGYELGTLTIYNVEAYLSAQGTASIHMKFVSTDGTTVIEWWIPQAAVPF